MVLDAFGAGNAFAGDQENEQGMMKQGLVADPVILERARDVKNPPFVSEIWRTGTRVYCCWAAYRTTPRETAG